LSGFTDTDCLRDAIRNLQGGTLPATPPVKPAESTRSDGKRQCAGCPTIFKPKTPQHRYCTRMCGKRAAGRERAKSQGLPYVGLSKNAMGALGELRVSADLMMRGYEVFRAVSPAASCDLIAIKDGRLLRIESRTAAYKKDGTRSQSKHQARDAGKQDVYAWVLPNRIEYEPSWSHGVSCGSYGGRIVDSCHGSASP